MSIIPATVLTTCILITHIIPSVNIDRLTFKEHGVLVSSEVKFWMQDNLVIPWAPFYPIKLILEPKPERRFLLKRLDDAARGLVPPIQW